MKEEILKVLELVEKGTITTEEANELIKQIKNQAGNNESGNGSNSSFEQTELYKKFKGLIKDASEFCEEAQPKVLKTTSSALKKTSGIFKNLSEKIDSSLEKGQAETTDYTDDVVVVDEVIVTK